MRVEVRGVKRQHVGRELEATYRSLSERDLRHFQFLVRHPLGDAMEQLPGEPRGRQTRNSREAIVEELR